MSSISPDRRSPVSALHVEPAPVDRPPLDQEALDSTSLDEQVDLIQVEASQRSPLAMLLKRMVQAAFTLWTLPRLVLFYLGRGLLGLRAFSAASESIARIPGMRGVYLRQAFYRQTLSHCGKDVYFGWMSAFSMTEARVEDRAYIGRFCSLGFADIGEEVMLADGVQVLSGGQEHDRSDSVEATIHSQGKTFRRVRIGKGSWIGAGAVIMADVGEHCIIGAGAVVNRPIPSGTVAVGVPAKVVKQSLRPRIANVS